MQIQQSIWQISAFSPLPMRVPKITAQQSKQEKGKREAGLFLTFAGSKAQIQKRNNL